MAECSIKTETCNFRCTGYDGSKVWDKLHSLPKEIDCQECATHAGELFTGIHDIVSVGLGKKPFDNDNLQKFSREVKCVWNTCVKEGRCHGHTL